MAVLDRCCCLQSRLDGAEPGRRAAEAFGEAGVRGTVERKPIGFYSSSKPLPSSELVSIRVTVFLFGVAVQLAAWPEQGERERLWVPVRDAAGMVAEPGLARLLRAAAIAFEEQNGAAHGMGRRDRSCKA